MRLVPRFLALALAAATLSCAPSSNLATAASVDSAPDFTIDLTTGETFRLRDHLGKKVIVIDFWTTFCNPCVGSLTHLNALYKKHKDNGLVVLAISMDPPDTAGNVIPFLRSRGLEIPAAHDINSTVTNLYNKKSTAPFQVLIGRDGRILKQRESYQPADDAAIQQDIETALAAR
ncbi:MAG: TlpA disulfide reductase family protein [Myxococcales bacterium]|nr:TlpA family protein disulfide reductase [Polyangiaceae bacterium]MDW8251329.1 TlpA disulfide reductase family protein [Myxococcales bacterium]